jgi:DNA-directed RNA polymerase beta subunit
MSKLPSHLREMHDTETARNWLYEDTLSALNKRFPVEDDNLRLSLHDVKFEPKTYSLTQQKDALLKNRQLRIPVTGTWRLTDKASGVVLDERPDTIMQLPYLTERGTTIYNGNEYSSVSQSRLKPGAYVRVRKSGEPEAFFNIRPRTGKSFRVWMEPDTGVFRVHVGQANIPLYQLMRAIGADDNQLLKQWGPEILTANMRASKAQDMAKLYARFAGLRADEKLDDAGKQQALRELLGKSEVDPDVVARTLGIPNAKGIDAPMLMRAAQKMLNVSRQEEDPDDRDAPKYSNVLSIEDLIPERINNDAGRLASTLLWKIKRDRSLKRLPPAALNPYVDNYLFGSRLTMPLEETNPLAILEQMSRVTKLGEGGISSAESITDEARNVNNGQFGFVDPVTGPEGMNIGIDVRTAYRTFKGRDKQLYAEFIDPKTGEKKYMRPEDLDNAVIAFPGEMAQPGDMATAMANGKMKEVPKSEVTLAVPSFAHMNSAATSLNPMPTGVQPARAFYGAKFWSQYMPQAQGEIPLVDSVMPDSPDTVSEHYGRLIGTLKAPAGGVVSRITDSAVTIKDKDGGTHEVELVKHFPFNRLTGISYFPTVQKGDVIEPGQMVAHSNFTDPKTGSLVMGQNLKTAVLPYKGRSYEDAYVISATAARRLATERLYGFDQDAKNGIELGRNRFASLFPERFTKAQLEKLDEHGVVQPGTVLEKGDPIIVAVGPKLLGPEDVQLGRLHKALRHAQTDKSTIWDHDYPGTVVDAVNLRGGAKVNIAAQVPVKVGDKLSTRYGLKGVVGTIVDDDKMPRDPGTDTPYDLLLNPMGILSRVAPAQLAEMQLAKLAKLTGKQVRIPQEPPEEGWNEWALKQLADAKIPESESVFDPEMGRNLPPVATGYTYTMAFHHLGEKKLSERGSTGVSYTADEQPSRGGGESQQAKKMSQMDMTALLAHGATEVIKDAQVIRGAKNDEFWKALKLGLPLPEPKVPFVYNKFLNTLKAGGINIRDQGNVMTLLPMTDDDVLKLSRGPIDNSSMVDDDMEPTTGGLFDVGKTGGLPGKFWSHVELNEPMPNPVFEEPIRRLLGLTQKQLEGVIAGTEQINGQSGGAGLKAALSAIDLDRDIAEAREEARKRRGSARDNAIKKIGYLSAAKKQGIHPSSWMITKVPILPPTFRPMSRMGDVTLQADLNELYRDLIETNSSLKELRKELPESALADERMTLYSALSAAYGLGDPITPEGRSKRLKGAIQQIIGDSPKTGLFQSRVLSKPVDVVGRGVVTPDPNLDMDSVGIPEDSAWTLYKDFVIRHLVRRNIPAHRALEMVKLREPTAKAALQEEMKTRPVIVDRAPTWHKFNLLAFYPHITEGTTVRVSPLITKGFTMDFDGDAVNFHVPISDKAVEQARERMLPSRNLFSLTDLRSIRHSPQQELGLGLYQLTQEPSKRPVQRFATTADALKAYRRGELRVNDPIEIG